VNRDEVREGREIGRQKGGAKKKKEMKLSGEGDES
jgi:hypothetical protein